MDQATLNYRQEYRARHVGRRYSGPAHFAFTALLSLGVIIGCAAQLKAVTPWEWATIPATGCLAASTAGREGRNEPPGLKPAGACGERETAGAEGGPQEPVDFRLSRFTSVVQ